MSTLLLNKALSTITDEINCLDKNEHKSPFKLFIHNIIINLRKLKLTHKYVYYSIVIAGYTITFILFVVACVYCLPVVVAILI
jgi:hypothetical protein